MKTYKSSYKSVPMVVSIIGSKSRKSMFIVNPTSLDGKKQYKNKWIPISWNESGTTQRTIEWSHHSQSYVEFPQNLITESMVIDDFNTRNVSNFASRLVDGNVQTYYTMIDRFVVYIPTWLMRTFELKFTAVPVVDDEYYHNDDNPTSVAEETCLLSHEQKLFDYMEDRVNMGFSSVEPALAQWEIDNPEYQ